MVLFAIELERAEKQEIANQLLADSDEDIMTLRSGSIVSSCTRMKVRVDLSGNASKQETPLA